ncbi:hypothetical protein ACFVVM_03255 [Nocardia sp. NPDC058176]|uniref:hypothetical protein n=1 Tax=Nocardia sp. NPDC058176 TaxID=3346368 RepID=UPI0036DEEACD
MADIYELLISVGLRADLSGEDIAELRWQVGEGEAPTDERRLSRGYVCVVEGEDGELVCTDPQPFLSQDGPAWKIDGTLSSSFRKTSTGWHLDARQEVHPEDFEMLEPLLIWLYRHVDFRAIAADGSVELGRLRWYEDTDSRPLVIRDNQVFWP